MPTIHQFYDGDGGSFYATYPHVSEGSAVVNISGPDDYHRRLHFDQSGDGRAKNGRKQTLARNARQLREEANALLRAAVALDYFANHEPAEVK